MKHFIKNITTPILDFLFTVHCPYCNKAINRSEYACENCKKHFPETAVIRYAVGGFKCASPFPYDERYKDAVTRFKFHNCGAYAKQLAFMIVCAIGEVYQGKNFDIITCVPMHKNALKQRGYNQAELLARECAEIMGIEYADVIEKFKENKLQHRIKANERAKNVRGVYRIPDKKIAYGKSVLIIDDIITTGNTLGECARILMKSGCKEVCCAALCTVTIP